MSTPAMYLYFHGHSDGSLRGRLASDLAGKQLTVHGRHPHYGMVVLFLIPILVLSFVAAVPIWPYSKNWGYYPTGGLGAILAITIVLLFLNRI